MLTLRCGFCEDHPAVGCLPLWPQAIEHQSCQQIGFAGSPWLQSQTSGLALQLVEAGAVVLHDPLQVPRQAFIQGNVIPSVNGEAHLVRLILWLWP